MRDALRIFKRDVLRLLRNPIALIITVGVCAIPSVYAWYNIVANWDPYGSTGNVKIAVANNDAGVTNELVGTMNAGDEVVEQLRGNDQLGWTFVSEDEAVRGVERGDYYAAIVVPEDFSTNLTSMFTGEFTEPKLGYYVNEKKNAIAPRVTDTGATTIEQQVNETFVATVTETVTEMAQRAEGKVGAEGSRATGTLLEGLDGAAAQLDEVAASLDGMGETVAAAKRTLGASDDALVQVADAAPSLEEALSSNRELLADTRDAASAFSTSLTDAVSAGSTKLVSASAHANEAIGTYAGVVSAAKTKVDLVLSDVGGVIDANQRIVDALDDLVDVPGIQEVVDKLRAMVDELEAKHDALQAQSDALGADLDALTNAADAVSGAVQAGSQQLVQTQGNLVGTVMPQLSNGLDSFSASSADLSAALGAMAPAIEQGRATLAQLSGTLDAAAATLETTSSSLGEAKARLVALRQDAAALQSSSVFGDISARLDALPEDIASLMSSPVELSTTVVYPVETYGSGVAPFYTNLALWVGGFVLIAIFKLEVDAEGIGAVSPTQAYMGRWLLMVVLGALQAVIVCVGDLVLGVQCVNAGLFVLAGVLISFAYVNIIYALASAFKHIGKALAVLLVIVQIPGSSGLYPIEMMPAVFRAIHPLLPFSYGIAAMRECVGGMYGIAYAQNLAVLAIFVVLSMVLGCVLRPALMNLNALFDRHLAATRVMICERYPQERPRHALRHIVAALLDVDEYRGAVVRRARAFERRYPRLLKLGWAVIFASPVVAVAVAVGLHLSIDAKIVVMLVWVAVLVAAVGYLIALEYVRASLNDQMLLSRSSEDELRRDLSARKENR